MNKTHAALMAILIAGAGTLSAQTAPGSHNASPTQHDGKQANQTQKQGASGGAPSSGAAGGVDCPPAMNQGAAERLDPPGPVGRTGSATAMVDDSGTIGSTGETRATTTSGATGTTGEFSGYRQDPSGSVTTAGSTGAATDPSMDCGPDAGASGASAARDAAAIGRSDANAQQ